jgi:hypothetical protein
MALMCVISASLCAITFKLGLISLTRCPRRFFLTHKSVRRPCSLFSYFAALDAALVCSSFLIKMIGPCLKETDLANCNTSIG